MLKTQNILIFLLSYLLLTTSNAFFKPWGLKKLISNKIYDSNINQVSSSDSNQTYNWNFTQTQAWFTQQKLDHFDLTNNNTWSQRYWVVSDCYNQSANGPVFLVICGEYTCPGLESDRLFPLELAQEFGALILVLEHRFYGLSQPFQTQNLTIDKLSYLNVDQALADLAYFIDWAKTSGNFSLNEDTKFISIGGSYPGALSAWFREKYPYLTVGALASSAVVNSFIDFPEFDGQVYTSLMKSGEECVLTIQAINAYVENQVLNDSTSQSIKSIFNATKLTNDEFLFFWADGIALLVQYGHRTEVCDLFSGNQTLNDQFNALRQYIAQVGESDPVDYGAYYLSDTEFSPDNDGSRQWTWQICSELGWFNTAPANASRSLRSMRLNITFYQNWCERVFGEKIWPVEGLANIYRGGKHIQATNLIMTNGCEDPWQWASLTESHYFGIKTYYIECDDCAHCVELYTPQSTDSEALNVTRQKIEDNFAKWLHSNDYGFIYEQRSDFHDNIFSIQ